MLAAKLKAWAVGASKSPKWSRHGSGGHAGALATSATGSPGKTKMERVGGLGFWEMLTKKRGPEPGPSGWP